MTPSEALKFLDGILSQVRVNRQEQESIRQAVDTLGKAVIALEGYREEDKGG